jgi:hypothetical protein
MKNVIDKMDGPIFVVGMNGSGTTMIADCLGNHPTLYAFPRETRILPYFIQNLSRFGDLNNLPARKKLADALGNSHPFWLINKKKPLRIGEQFLDEPSFEGVVNSIFIHFAKLEGKYRWIEKSPMYVQHIETLAKNFPSAKFIHIYRDGRDVAYSLYRRWKRHPCLTIYRWRHLVRIGQEQGNKIGKNRYKEISYEDLTNNPEKKLKEVCHFLGVDFHPNLLKSKSRHMDRQIETDKIIKNSGKWKHYFSQKEITHLESIGGKFLQELGYEIESTPGNRTPSWMKIRLWLFTDKIKLVIYNLKTYGISVIPALLRTVKDSLLQSKTNQY